MKRKYSDDEQQGELILAQDPYEEDNERQDELILAQDPYDILSDEDVQQGPSLEEQLTQALSAPEATASATTARATYLNIVANRDPQKAFLELAAKVIKLLPTTNVESKMEVLMTTPGQIITVLPNRELFSVGRLSSCNVVLENPTASRFHCILFRNGNLVHLLDMGSLNKTRVTRCHGDGKVRDEEVKVNMVFDASESLIIECGGDQIGLNIKKCIVCFEETRSILLGCGHFSLCVTCNSKIDRCPLCRNPSDHFICATRLLTKGKKSQELQ